MYITSVPNRGSPPAILLRESYREDGKVKNRTLANLTHWSPDVVEALGVILKGGKAVGSVEDLFETKEDYHHGHVLAVLTAMERLGFASLIASQPSRERNLVLAMVVSRILAPDTKLATTRWWHVTTLPQELGVGNATEDDLYRALDWLIERQVRIENKLAARHLANGDLALCDLTSTYFEGSHCPLAHRGYSRDGKKGTLKIVWSLLTDRRGCPVAATVYPGNTSDATTLLSEVATLKEQFGLSHLVLVGNRGLVSQKQIDELKEVEGVEWITALKSSQIRALVDSGLVQLGLFDERNLFEIAHPDYPDERLVAFRNPELTKLRAAKHEDLLQATCGELEKVRTMVERGRLKGKGQDEIGVRVGRVVNKFKVAKHVDFDIRDGGFDFAINADRVAEGAGRSVRDADGRHASAVLDGIYVIRTSLAKERLSAEDAVRSYKTLTQVERAFRSLKTVDLHVRPIHHRLEDRVRAHIFMCMLAYYVEWHMREAWREILFADEDQEAKKTRDPVAPAKRSNGAAAKAATKQLPDGTVVHSFRTLLTDLSGVVRTIFRRKAASGPATTLAMTTTLSPARKYCLDLLDGIAL